MVASGIPLLPRVALSIPNRFSGVLWSDFSKVPGIFMSSAYLSVSVSQVSIILGLSFDGGSTIGVKNSLFMKFKLSLSCFSHFWIADVPLFFPYQCSTYGSPPTESPEVYIGTKAL